MLSSLFFAGNENERARHIRLHERVNALPDPNYSTLKYLMGHLHRCVTLLSCLPCYSRAPALVLPCSLNAPRTRSVYLAESDARHL